MTAPRIPRVHYMRPLTTCQASETGCAAACDQGRACPDSTPMTADDLVCAVILVAVIAAPFVGVAVWRWI